MIPGDNGSPAADRRRRPDGAIEMAPRLGRDVREPGARALPFPEHGRHPTRTRPSASGPASPMLSSARRTGARSCADHPDHNGGSPSQRACSRRSRTHTPGSGAARERPAGDRARTPTRRRRAARRDGARARGRTSELESAREGGARTRAARERAREAARDAAAAQAAVRRGARLHQDRRQLLEDLLRRRVRAGDRLPNPSTTCPSAVADLIDELESKLGDKAPSTDGLLIVERERQDGEVPDVVRAGRPCVGFAIG